MCGYWPLAKMDIPESNFRWGKRTYILVMVPWHCVAFAEHTDFNHDYLRSQTELTTMIGMKPPAGPGDRAHPRHSLKECEGLVNKAKAQLLENGALPEQSTYSDVLLCVCS